MDAFCTCVWRIWFLPGPTNHSNGKMWPWLRGEKGSGSQESSALRGQGHLLCLFTALLHDTCGTCSVSRLWTFVSFREPILVVNKQLQDVFWTIHSGYAGVRPSWRFIKLAFSCGFREVA